MRAILQTAGYQMFRLQRVRTTARRTLQQNIYELLKAALMSGTYSPGQHLTVRQIADEVGTSPMPVREAIKQLITEGALQYLPNGQVRVCEMSREQRDDAREIRAALEALAVRRAAANLTDAQIKKIENSQKAMVAALNRGDLNEALSHNLDFHFGIYRASRSEMLLRLIEGLWMQNGPFLMLYTDAFRDEVGKSGMDCHSTILTALRRRDADLAEKAIRADIALTAHLGSEKRQDDPDAPQSGDSRRRTASRQGTPIRSRPGEGRHQNQTGNKGRKLT